MKVAILCSDLMFRAKIRDAIARQGHEAARSDAPDAGLAVIDVGETRVDPIATIRTLRAKSATLPIVGFASHVRTELFDEGRAAGCSEVVPRSRAIEVLEAYLAVPDR